MFKMENNTGTQNEHSKINYKDLINYKDILLLRSTKWDRPDFEYPSCPLSLTQPEDKDLFARLKTMYERHSGTWDKETKDSWFWLLPLAMFQRTNQDTMSSHPISKPRTEQPLTWAYVVILRELYPLKFFASKKLRGRIRAKYPGVNLDMHTFSSDFPQALPQNHDQPRATEQDHEPITTPNDTNAELEARNATSSPSPPDISVGLLRTNSTPPQSMRQETALQENFTNEETTVAYFVPRADEAKRRRGDNDASNSWAPPTSQLNDHAQDIDDMSEQPQYRRQESFASEEKRCIQRHQQNCQDMIDYISDLRKEMEEKVTRQEEIMAVRYDEMRRRIKELDEQLEQETSRREELERSVRDLKRKI